MEVKGVNVIIINKEGLLGDYEGLRVWFILWGIINLVYV